MGKSKNKLVTVDDYRMDRDYWKRRSYEQQQVIDIIRRKNEAFESTIQSLESQVTHLKKELAEICPHDKINWEDTSLRTGHPWCDRCYKYVDVSEDSSQ